MRMGPQHAVGINEICGDQVLAVVLSGRPLAPDYKRAFRMKNQTLGQLRGPLIIAISGWD